MLRLPGTGRTFYVIYLRTRDWLIHMVLLRGQMQQVNLKILLHVMVQQKLVTFFKTNSQQTVKFTK